ncbi:MAG: hypothetical protein AAF628_31250 [Planctomycetota bacterium]
MPEIREFVIRGPSPGGGWMMFMAPGVALFLLGLAILVWPQLLVAMVAGVFMAMGLALASMGWRMRPPG